MNDGRITAVDAIYYVNGGCTPDESVLVRIFFISSGLGKSFLAFRKFIVIVIQLLSLYISILGQHLLCCIPQFLTYRSAKYKMFLALILSLGICVCSG